MATCGCGILSGMKPKSKKTLYTVLGLALIGGAAYGGYKLYQKSKSGAVSGLGRIGMTMTPQMQREVWRQTHRTMASR